MAYPSTLEIQIVVRIAAERIMSGGLNPKTSQTYVIEVIRN
ncbi:hypothetical protein [Lysinibacillus sp. fls2-241-R2A-57]|nr:hypothetical protein [Lysinibacillus sp. fls2-241-R2A-57]